MVSYLLYDEPVEMVSQDRAWRWREATAEAIDRSRDRVRIRQAHRLRPSDSADRRLAALRTQAALLTELGGAHGLPRLRELHDDPDTVTLISSHPAGPTWREVFGPSGSPLDRLTAAALLDATRSLCAGLLELHRRGHAHRSLSPDNIVITRKPRRAVPLDLGLAAIEPAAGEGVTHWRAPEQMRLGKVGPRTDAWQVAALLYHTLTGHPPSPQGSPPIRTSIPEFPVELDNLITLHLGVAPDRRAGGLGRLGSALREGRAMLSKGRG
jgi:serine/threonine protein kinase